MDLSHACLENDLEKINRLIESGENPDSVFELACKISNKDVLELLIAKGAKITESHIIIVFQRNRPDLFMMIIKKADNISRSYCVAMCFITLIGQIISSIFNLRRNQGSYQIIMNIFFRWPMQKSDNSHKGVITFLTRFPGGIYIWNILVSVISLIILFVN
jgi:hypothetical protein